MTVDTDAGGFPTVGPDDAELAPYETIVLDDGRILVYAPDCEDAWLQSDEYVELAAMA